MNRVKILTGAVIFLFLLNAGLIFFLMGQKHPHLQPKREIIRLLELDKEQVAEYEKMIEAHQSNIEVHDTKITELKQALYQGLIDVEVDRDSIFNVLSKEQIIVEKMHYNHFREVGTLCNNDSQKESFKKLTKRLTALFSIRKQRRK
jgi:hypothetical protein